MGFDVVYLPPIHPIGRTARKGPNNALAAAPGDPGSPWAIGAPEGGHTAVHPELGTLEDFRRLVTSAQGQGSRSRSTSRSSARPITRGCASTPSGSTTRPDGTIKYAENPPKKYQDIYPLNFATTAWASLWDALLRRGPVLDRAGVRTFRVDNPHTKPLDFWAWLIREVQDAHPDVIFLAEAFTRPKVMQALGKAGFTQSYTYFTWRNFKEELTEYLEELTRRRWPSTSAATSSSTPRTSSPRCSSAAARPAFRMRAALAATLSSV